MANRGGGLIAYLSLAPLMRGARREEDRYIDGFFGLSCAALFKRAAHSVCPEMPGISQDRKG
jgi:hypothetical protein